MSEHQRVDLGDSLFDDEGYRSPTTLAVVAVIGIVLACAANILQTDIVTTRYTAITNYVADQTTIAGLYDADDYAATWAWPTRIASLVAIVAFLFWWRRAHLNAKWFGGPDSQRRSGPWVIGAWVCPIVNFWFPYQMVADAWRASAIRRPARGATLVLLWWLLFVVGGPLSLYITREVLILQFAATPVAVEESLHTLVTLARVDTGLTLAAGALIIVIIIQLTRWQTTPRDPS